MLCLQLEGAGLCGSWESLEGGCCGGKRVEGGERASQSAGGFFFFFFLYQEARSFSKRRLQGKQVGWPSTDLATTGTPLGYLLPQRD